MKKLTKILCALLVVLTMSCAKDGATGPQGPAGTNGINGNANVLYSDWFTIASWSGSSGAYTFNKSESQVTQTIIDQGVVLAFAKLAGDGTNIRPFPANTAGSAIFWNYILTVGNIQFTTNVSSPSTTNQFRYVIIPSTTSLRLAKPLKNMTYEEICERYSIPK